MYKIGKMPLSVDIGFVGEKNFRRIEIDMSAWMEDTPDGVPSIVHVRPGETKADAYIAITDYDRETKVLTWAITAGDIGTLEGEGEMQIWLEEEENDSIVKRGKSVKVKTIVTDAVNDPSEVVPSSAEALIEQMTALKTATVTAKNAAEDAQTAAETAQGKAEDAQEGAESAQDAAEDAAFEAESAQTAAETAQGKAEDAQTAAETAQGSAEAAQTAAEAAQEAAETAQGKAEDAQDAAEDAQAAAETAQAAAEAAAAHYPQIDGTTGNWLVWDAQEEEYVDTGVKAEGHDGQDGAPGADGFSPTATVSKSGKVTTVSITDKNGTTTAQILDGEDGGGGDPSDLIDDTAGAGDTDKTFSADKLTTDHAALLSEITNNATEEDLLRSEMPGTSTTVTMDSNGNPTSIVHTANSATVRTDTFVWGTGTVTETRTLANGKYITITTNLDTLAQTISAVQEVA